MSISEDSEGISMLESDRYSVVENNNTHKENDAGLLGMIIGSVVGGGIRETKKSMKCGCNSNLSLQECCSMGRK